MEHLTLKDKIFLNPGQLYVGNEDIVVETVLGSCVSIIAFNEKYKIGAICHYLLPFSIMNRNNTKGYSGELAIEYFADKMKKFNTSFKDYTYKIFGGSCISQSENKICADTEIGFKNVDFANKFVQKHRLNLVSSDTGGSYSRRVVFDVSTGEIWLKKYFIDKGKFQ